MSLPSGTVTFLFTDIEGSTQSWEANRDKMEAAVSRHDALMRAAIERHDGYVFKTVGDAFCAAFERASDGIAASTDAQHALSGENFSTRDGLRVRMALHAGEASERDGDYFGPAVNRVARLMSIGHGGQILVSSVARELALDDLPPQTTLIDLGSHRLKDLAQPEHVWQLAAPGLIAHFPPLRSLDALPNNLPIQSTSFRGREHDLEAVKLLLVKHRLLTLFGAGGVGKTRLALQVGADMLDRFPDGVWFADLAAISDPELVSSVVAKVLGMRQPEGRPVDELIPQWLRGKQVLLIVDNCEHVIEPVAKLADAILNTDPEIRLLATSRQALGIIGEEVLRLPSLSVPDSGSRISAGRVTEFGAAALFVDRATSVNQNFHLTDENAPIVADICRRLDGIPLAIELAAARMKVLSVVSLAQRLDERFKILVAGSRTALPRHKTLGALIGWSYDLLSSQEQIFFSRACMFAGGFGLDAAMAVCTSEGIDNAAVFELITSLVDKSLLVADTGGKKERYGLLESIRAYGLDKLKAGGDCEGISRRHAEYFLELSLAADRSFGTLPDAAWLTPLETELDNFRAALEWFRAPGNDIALGGAIAGSLEQLWRGRGIEGEGRYWINVALERIAESEHPGIAARLWRALATLTSGKQCYEAAGRACALYEKLGEGRGLAQALHQLAFGLIQMGRLHEADAVAKRALGASQECGDKRLIANCLNQQAYISSQLGDLAAARELYAQALPALKARGDESGVASALSNIAELEFKDGNAEHALRSVTEAIAIQSGEKNTTNLAISHINSAAYQIALGHLDEAREAAREGLRYARDAQAACDVASQHLALIAALRGDAVRAAHILGFVDARYAALGMEREFTEKWSYEKLLTALRQQLDDAEIQKLAAHGAAWSQDQALEEALKV